MTSITAIFFDLDGTLVDSSIGIHNAFTHTFKELEYLALMPNDSWFYGTALESSFATCLPKDQILRLSRYTVLTIMRKASMKLNLSLRL